MKKLSILFIVVFFMFNGCVTKNLWKPEDTIEKNEAIKQFLVSEDKKIIIFLGENYHFVFDGDQMDSDNYKQMIKLLKLSKEDRKLISINEEATKIYIDQKSEMKCVTVLDVSSKDLDEEKIKFFEDLGFYHIKGYQVLSIRLNLKGKVYKTNERFKKYAKGLNKEYILKLFVKEDGENGYSTWEKIALTPLTLTGDVLVTATGLGVGALAISTGNPDAIEGGVKIMYGTVKVQLESLGELTGDMIGGIKQGIKSQ